MFDFSKLKGRMRERNFTQQGLADVIGISTAALNNKLRCKVDFTSRETVAICKALGISFEEVGDYFFCLATIENAS